MSQAWIPSGWSHPARADLIDGFHLRPIHPDDTDLDMPAVMGSQQRLWSMFGDVWGWPEASMTAEEDRVSLGRDRDRMRAHESFNYAIFDAAETELVGCVYIDPTDRVGADADVTWWVREEYLGSGVEAALETWVPRWIAADWPFESPRYVGHDLSWDAWSALRLKTESVQPPDGSS